MGKRNNFKVEWWPVDRPKPYKSNPRLIPETAVAKVAASIKEFGWRQPIVVDTDGVIIVGHSRKLAAKYLGLKDVPVHVASDLTPEQIRAYRIADNKTSELADWDDELLAAEIDALSAVEFNLSLTGFSEPEIFQLAEEGVEINPEAEWQGMPEFSQEDQLAFRTIKVHFRDQSDVDAFAELISQAVTPKARYLWFPAMEIERTTDKRFRSAT